MKKFAIFSGLFFLLIAITLLALVKKHPGKLVIAKNGLTIQAPGSSMLAAEFPPARFDVTNIGGEPVRFVSFDSSCGCATPGRCRRRLGQVRRALSRLS